MSTTTTNLGLHQWEEDDYVLMEEFNADHAAIDAYVDLAAMELDEAKNDLLEGQIRLQRNIFHLLAPDYFAGSLGWTPQGMVVNGLASAEETGQTTGFVWSKHPIHLGLYSGGIESDGTVRNDLDVLDARISKTVPLDGIYTHATLLVQARGWYSRVPPLSAVAYQIEDYTGITLSATLDGAAMSPAAHGALSWQPDGSPLREYCFELTGCWQGSATVTIDFHCPADRGLSVYDWALILA